MAITFKSVGHFFAKGFSAIGTGIAKVIGTEATVEKVTSEIPGVAIAVPVEKAAYAVLGEVASLLTAGDAAAKAKLADAGLDTNVVDLVEELLKSVPSLVAMAKAL